MYHCTHIETEYQSQALQWWQVLIGTGRVDCPHKIRGEHLIFHPKTLKACPCRKTTANVFLKCSKLHSLGKSNHVCHLHPIFHTSQWGWNIALGLTGQIQTQLMLSNQNDTRVALQWIKLLPNATYTRRISQLLHTLAAFYFKSLFIGPIILVSKFLQWDRRQMPSFPIISG